MVILSYTSNDMDIMMMQSLISVWVMLMLLSSSTYSWYHYSFTHSTHINMLHIMFIIGDEYHTTIGYNLLIDRGVIYLDGEYACILNQVESIHSIIPNLVAEHDLCFN